MYWANRWCMVEPIVIQPVDLQYVERVAARTIRLERAEIGVRQDIARTHEDMLRLSTDLHDEMLSMHQELNVLAKETDQIVDHLKHILIQFKDVAKRQDMNRLQARVDVWAPETKISRDQFKRMLEKNS